MSPKEPRLWALSSGDDQTFVCSTDRAHIQDDRVAAAFASDLVWWAKPLSPDQLAICLDNSLCFGLYETTNTTGTTTPLPVPPEAKVLLTLASGTQTGT